MTTKWAMNEMISHGNKYDRRNKIIFFSWVALLPVTDMICGKQSYAAPKNCNCSRLQGCRQEASRSRQLQRRPSIQKPSPGYFPLPKYCHLIKERAKWGLQCVSLPSYAESPRFLWQPLHRNAFTVPYLTSSVTETLLHGWRQASLKPNETFNWIFPNDLTWIILAHKGINQLLLALHVMWGWQRSCKSGLI